MAEQRVVIIKCYQLIGNSKCFPGVSESIDGCLSLGGSVMELLPVLGFPRLSHVDWWR